MILHTSAVPSFNGPHIAVRSFVAMTRRWIVHPFLNRSSEYNSQAACEVAHSDITVRIRQKRVSPLIVNGAGIDVCSQHATHKHHMEACF